MARIAVLVSGRGSNLQSIIDNVEAGGIPNSDIVLVISDRKDAYALERARKHNIEHMFIDPGAYESREEFDQRVVEEVQSRNTDLVLLAGYMRLVTPVLVDAFRNRMMNIHPALLPSFPGLHAQQQALDHGVKVSGCTVHFVDEEVDHGPIIVQAAVPVLEGDDEAALAKRIIQQEHLIYPQAVKWFVEGRLTVEGRRLKIKGVERAARGLRVL